MDRIDAYSHLMPTRAFEEFKGIHDAEPPGAVNDPIMTEEGIEDRLELLDEFGIDRQVISLTLPRVMERTNPEDAVELTRIANDEIRRIADEHPDRFVPIATVPFLHGEYVDEVERALSDLDMAGVQIDSNVNGRMIDDEEFYPFYEAVNDADVPIYIHPTTTDWHPYTEHEAFIYRIVGWPFDTTMATLRLIYNGLLEEFENIEVVSHHLGGVLPYLEERLRSWTRTRVRHQDNLHPDERDAADDRGPLPRYSGELDDYLDRVYGDTAIFSLGKTNAMRTGYDFFGPENVVFAFDYPYARRGVLENTVAALEGLGLTEEEERKLYAGNAERLLDI